jgi:hypothetical protein
LQVDRHVCCLFGVLSIWLSDKILRQQRAKREQTRGSYGATAYRFWSFFDAGRSRALLSSVFTL